MQKRENSYIVFLKSILIVILGSLSFPNMNVIGALSILPIAILLLNTLMKGDPFSFVIQLFTGAHFTYGKQIGSVFLIAAGIALILWTILFNKRKFKNQLTSTGKKYIFLLCVILFIQVLSILFYRDFEFDKKIISILYIILITQFVIYFSGISISEIDIKRFVYCLFLTCLYSVIVSINQFSSFLPTNSLWPTYDENAIFEKEIFRNSGTFLNYEIYAEYSLSIITILLPGIVSGSIKKYNTRLHYIAIITVALSLYSIILSGTRSSLFLFPICTLIVLYRYRNKINKTTFIAIFVAAVVGYLTPDITKILNLDSFILRNDSLENTTLDKVMTGEAINRAATFSYGLEKIQNKLKDGTLLIGEGYYTFRDEYRDIHFDKSGIEFPDYHNLYMSLIVIWGIGGAWAFISIFILSINSGIKAYKKIKNTNSIYSDLLYGFNLMFIFLMINQLKIQFIRDSNYLFLIMILLVIYISLSESILNFSKKIIKNEDSLVY
ncbi:hypothetical protein GCM10028803_56500 [Larkinella knui]|uniref:O-antigen ligase domain-containing protein n=1 Tax=Larkinella knui TaxID=2025310 RepID=A0A3P1CHZ5_9BACT|nr:O-antigen ligase family protein [Larkinella knui]RRB12899.1 hypothetical protein EHT87_22285 [Larkinella knui]